MFWTFLRRKLSATCRRHLAGLLSMHNRRLAIFRSMAYISWCTSRIIVEFSQITCRLFHDVSLSSRLLIPTSAVFSVATIGRAPAITRRRISGISTLYHRSKEIAAAGVSLLCDRLRNRSPPTNTDVGLPLCTTDRPNNWESPTCRCRRFLCDFSLSWCI